MPTFCIASMARKASTGAAFGHLSPQQLPTLIREDPIFET